MSEGHELLKKENSALKQQLEKNAVLIISEGLVEKLNQRKSNYFEYSVANLIFIGCCFLIIFYFLFYGHLALSFDAIRIANDFFKTSNVQFSKEHLLHFMIVSIVFSKVAILGTIFYLLLFLVKNYNANRHNAMVCEHRAFCISMYDSFMSSDFLTKETKDVITSHAADAIFSYQETGILKTEGGHANFNMPNLINLGGQK